MSGDFFGSSIFDFRLLAQMALPAPNASPSLPPIRDIAPPIDVFPYPLWMVIAAAAVALIVLGFFTWLFVRWWKNRPAPAPLMPREQALMSLREAQRRMDEMEPYAFSILVSDILRRYISAQFGLHATEQTSPEFLASVANSPRFTDNEKSLLAAFLEKCDLIKFARIEATRADSAELLEQASQFVNSTKSETPNAPSKREKISAQNSAKTVARASAEIAR